MIISIEQEKPEPLDCFICYEKNTNNLTLLTCCKRYIHVSCLVTLLLYEFQICPWCRCDINIKLNKELLQQSVTQLEPFFRKKFKNEINHIIYSHARCCSRYKLYSCYNLNKKIILVFLFIIFIVMMFAPSHYMLSSEI